IIYLTVLVAVIVIPIRLGGFGSIFAAIPAGKTLLAPSQYWAYATLAFGSALTLFMYPHSITGVLASERRQVVKRNMALLPAYSFLLGVIALLGYMAIAAGVQPSPAYGAQWAVPGLFSAMFPSWFAGFAFAAIAIGALVPASVMSIAAANLFTRNIYTAYFRPRATNLEESNVAKTVSLVVKAGALAFIVFLPTAYAINLQLLGGVWIIQTLPAIVLGLYTRWFHRGALFAGWAVGIACGTWMAMQSGLKSSTFILPLGAQGVPGYAALWALIANLIVVVALTLVFRAVRVPVGSDETEPHDYREERARRPVPELRREPVAPLGQPARLL